MSVDPATLTSSLEASLIFFVVCGRVRARGNAASVSGSDLEQARSRFALMTAAVLEPL